MDYNNWFALSINMNKERSCKEQLMARQDIAQDPYLTGVEYLQQKELVIQKSGKRAIRNKLLMSGYLLVQVKPEIITNEDGTTTKKFPGSTFNLITGTPGIKFFVNCDQDKPIAFRPREIKKLFDMCDDAHLELQQAKANDFQEGDTVEVIQGPFKGYDIEIIAINGEKILGHLDMFGRVVPAEFTPFQLYKKND